MADYISNPDEVSALYNNLILSDPLSIDAFLERQTKFIPLGKLAIVIQLYPKELDLGLNQLFVETILSDCQAEVRVDHNAPRLAQEIRVKGDYIVGALALLLGQQCIDDETVESIEARMQSVRETLPAANENRAPLQPFAEKIAAFVAENQNQNPDVTG